MQEYTKEELIFGLDIGTRTVIGVVGYKRDNQLVVIAYDRIEHEERAMQDGQIHDIQKVAQAVMRVKKGLEDQLQIKLSEVAIAAAGRSLSTQIVSVENNYTEVQEFDIGDIHNLELYGVEKAKLEQDKKSQQMEYFCVAYSVINYYLDGYVISNLEGHKGTSIGAKVIATFLPKLVIDSLYAVVERCDLKVSHLTLEPIAAINAIIPENLRLLNLALVDIGAGTSDIAITREGSVVAYGMIPIAGDEVTEAIVHHYLVDFQTAEKIKHEMKQNECITFEDILGFPQEVKVSEVKKVIHESLETLLTSIADKILELNGGHSTNAVFCVGGGSEMHGVESRLSELLQLPSQRVAMRTVSHITQIKDEASMCNSPDMITPVGISLTSMKNKYNEFTTVVLNGKKLQLLNAKKLTVCDAIIAAGIPHTSVFPKKGTTLMFKLNGERIRIKGGNGIPAQILLNQKEATMNDLIVEGDVITLEGATPGQEAKATVGDYIKETKRIEVDNEVIHLPIILVNGDCVGLDYAIQEGDQVEYMMPDTLKALFEALHQDISQKLITVNFKVIEDINYHLLDGDSILTGDKGQGALALGEKEGNYSKKDKASEVFLSPTSEERVEEKVKTEVLTIFVNDKEVYLPKKSTSYMFANIFDYIDFDLSTPRGTIQLMRNGQLAALTDNLCDQDKLDIFWKN